MLRDFSEEDLLEVEAYKKIGDVRRSSIVRLQGTNAEAGARIIDESRLKVKLATLLRRRR